MVRKTEETLMINQIKERVKSFDVKSMNTRDLLYLFRLVKELEDYDYSNDLKKDLERIRFSLKEKTQTYLDREDYCD